MVKDCGCSPIKSNSSAKEKNLIIQEVKHILHAGIYYQWELTDGRRVLDLIQDKEYGEEETRYVLTPVRGNGHIVMTLIDEKPSKEGILLEEGRYILHYHCLPEDGVNPDIHHELNLYPKSSERYYKLQYMKPPKQGYREYYCYPGPGSPRAVI